LSAAGVQPQ